MDSQFREKGDRRFKSLVQKVEKLIHLDWSEIYINYIGNEICKRSVLIYKSVKLLELYLKFKILIDNFLYIYYKKKHMLNLKIFIFFFFNRMF